MKRVKIALAVLAVALVSVIVWQVAQPSEPEPLYKGKPLSFYVQAYIRDPLRPKGVPTRQEAEEALRQAGTNAIPTLLRMIRATDSPLKLKLINLARKQHIFLQHRPAYFSNYAAMEMFHVLGPKAAGAVPALLDIASQNTSPDCQFCALQALVYIGPAAKETVPTLLRWATNADPRLRRTASDTLRRVDPKAALNAGIP